MGAVLKILGFVLAALGLVAWLGGVGAVAWDIARDPLALGGAGAMASAGVAVAGLLIAAVGAVVVLRVTHNLISYAICFACGALAFFGGLKLSPLELLNQPIQAALLVGLVAAPVAVLAVTKKMVYFLSTFALVAALAAAVVFTQGGMQRPRSESVGAPAVTAPATAPPVTEDAAQPPVADNVPLPSPPAKDAGTAQKPAASAPATPAPPPVVAEQAPVDREIAAAPPPAPAEEGASRGLGGASRGLGGAVAGSVLGGLSGRSRSLGGAAAPAPPPPPPAVVADDKPAGPDLSARSGGGAATASRGPTAAPSAPASRSLQNPEPTATTATAAPAAAPKPPTADDFGYKDANLKFNKPNTMELGREYNVGATITLPGSVATPSTLGDVGPTVTRETKILRKVRVELVGGGAFDVTAKNPVTTFLITANTPGVWNWTVKPRQEGKGTMQIQVFGVQETNGVPDGDVLITTYEETIPITVTPMTRVRLISENVVQNWEPVAGALGAIGGIWAFFANFFAGLRRKREAA